MTANCIALISFGIVAFVIIAANIIASKRVWLLINNTFFQSWLPPSPPIPPLSARPPPPPSPPLPNVYKGVETRIEENEPEEIKPYRKLDL